MTRFPYHVSIVTNGKPVFVSKHSTGALAAGMVRILLESGELRPVQVEFKVK